jgi:hypothetical protein
VWVGRLLFHRVEALARVARPTSLDRLSVLVLNALCLGGPRRPALDDLEDSLRLGRPLLRQVLRRLESEGVVATAQRDPRATETAGTVWNLTPAGQQALEHGSYPRTIVERRAFHFVEGGAGPRFLSLLRSDLAGDLPVPPADWQFDPALLVACAHQAASWKQLHGFPPEVLEIVTMPDTAGSDRQEADWQRVIVDYPQQLFVLLLRGWGGGDRLVSFVVRPDSWGLQSDGPCFSLEGEAWPEVFPGLVEDPPLDQWRQAWRAWSQPRSLPSAEVEACELERAGVRLQVRMARRLFDRLRAARSDALKGEAWILAGEGPLRAAASLEIVAAE